MRLPDQIMATKLFERSSGDCIVAAKRQANTPASKAATPRPPALGSALADILPEDRLPDDHAAAVALVRRLLERAAFEVEVPRPIELGEAESYGRGDPSIDIIATRPEVGRLRRFGIKIVCSSGELADIWQSHWDIEVDLDIDQRWLVSQRGAPNSPPRRRVSDSSHTTSYTNFLLKRRQTKEAPLLATNTTMRPQPRSEEWCSPIKTPCYYQGMHC